MLKEEHSGVDKAIVNFVILFAGSILICYRECEKISVNSKLL